MQRKNFQKQSTVGAKFCYEGKINLKNVLNAKWIYFFDNQKIFRTLYYQYAVLIVSFEEKLPNGILFIYLYIYNYRKTKEDAYSMNIEWLWKASFEQWKKIDMREVL